MNGTQNKQTHKHTSGNINMNDTLWNLETKNVVGIIGLSSLTNGAYAIILFCLDILILSLFFLWLEFDCG